MSYITRDELVGKQRLQGAKKSHVFLDGLGALCKFPSVRVGLEIRVNRCNSLPGSITLAYL